MSKTPKPAIGADAAKVGKVRVVSVDARCSESRLISVPPFVQRTANGLKEPTLPIFCLAANVRIQKTGGITSICISVGFRASLLSAVFVAKPLHFVIVQKPEGPLLYAVS